MARGGTVKRRMVRSVMAATMTSKRTLNRLSKADAKYREARAERRSMMLAAVADGVPVAEVADACCVTRDAVYKLVQASRRDDR